MNFLLIYFDVNGKNVLTYTDIDELKIATGDVYDKYYKNIDNTTEPIIVQGGELSYKSKFLIELLS